MRKIIVTEYVSLDGVMEDPGGGEGFQYGGWTRKFWDNEIGKFKYAELFSADALLLGRLTYEGFARAWPTMPGTGDFGERMNSISKYVASTSLQKAEWQNSTILKQDVAAEVARLKSQPGQDILIAGSGGLIQTLLGHNLIDQFDLLVYPVALGAGKRLFKEGGQAALQFVETKTFPSGVVLLRYKAAENTATP